MIALSTDFLSPVLFRRVRAERVRATMVRDDLGRLYAEPNDAPKLAVKVVAALSDEVVGTQGIIRATERLTFVTDAELQAEADALADRQRAQRAAAAERERKRQEQRAANRAFNAALQIAAKWIPGYRIVLSDLTANSCGDGTRRNTVHHVVLQESFEARRLKRDAGDLLCSKNRGSFDLGGAPSSYCCRDQFADSHDGYDFRVDCKACLKVASRLRASA